MKVNVSPAADIISEEGEVIDGSLSDVLQEVSAKLITIVMIRSWILAIVFIISGFYS